MKRYQIWAKDGDTWKPFFSDGRTYSSKSITEGHAFKISALSNLHTEVREVEIVTELETLRQFKVEAMALIEHYFGSGQGGPETYSFVARKFIEKWKELK